MLSIIQSSLISLRPSVCLKTKSKFLSLYLWNWLSLFLYISRNTWIKTYLACFSSVLFLFLLLLSRVSVSLALAIAAPISAAILFPTSARISIIAAILLLLLLFIIMSSLRVHSTFPAIIIAATITKHWHAIVLTIIGVIIRFRCGPITAILAAAVFKPPLRRRFWATHRVGWTIITAAVTAITITVTGGELGVYKTARYVRVLDVGAVALNIKFMVDRLKVLDIMVVVVDMVWVRQSRRKTNEDKF